MTNPHQPSDETLAAFAAGTLDEGLSLVVAAHVETNTETARRLREIQAVRGALLDTIEPVAMDAAARERALGRLAPRSEDRPPSKPPALPDVPRTLAPYELGRWQPIGRGIALRRVAVHDSRARVFMLRAGPGIWLPAHRHTGLEWTAILSGAYEHQYGRFAAGDFDEAGESHEHRPVVDPVEGCVCLVALTGKVLFEGWLGRLLQTVVRL
jgi:putative transcriptional regulator